MALLSALPLPRYEHTIRNAYKDDAPVLPPPPTKSNFDPPAYGERAGFVPRTDDDFGDGGAFPEIHILQFPLSMGRKEKSEGKVVPLKVDAEGKIKFDVILRQGINPKQKVFSQFSDMVEKEESEDNLQKPSQEEEQKVAEKTRAALGKTVNEKIAAAQPTRLAQEESSDPIFIRYTPSQQGESFNSGSRQRIIRLQEVQSDPLEPPKFKHKRLPPSSSDAPVPIMHSPPRPTTVQDQQNWKVPPCVSNWKNIKGYTVPLDKRMASDGRGLQETQINDKFAQLSESLFVAERTARKEIEARAAMARKYAQRQKDLKEDELRTLASAVRRNNNKKADDEEEEEEREPETEQDVDAREQREALRKDRERELRRDQRLEAKKVEKGRGVKETERDVSEKIALGQAVAKSKDSMFDQRLFNQSEGMSSGFNTDDSYDLYEKPLLKGSSANFLYKPSKTIGEEEGEAQVTKILEKGTTKYRADKEFKGTERDRVETAHTARTKPVEFEKEQDAFNIGQLFSEAKTGKKQRDSLSHIGKGGHMSASTTGPKEDYEGGSHRKKRMEFDESESSRKKKR
jgi:SNW domain-containing protein 1